MKTKFLIISLMVGIGSCYAFESMDRPFYTGQHRDQRGVDFFYRLMDGTMRPIFVPYGLTNRDFNNLIANNEGLKPSEIKIFGDNGRVPYPNNDEPLSYDFVRESVMRVVKKQPTGDLSAAASGAVAGVRPVLLSNMFNFKMIDGPTFSVNVEYSSDVGINEIKGKDLYEAVKKSGHLPLESKDFKLVAGGTGIRNNNSDLPEDLQNNPKMKITLIVMMLPTDGEAAAGAGQEPAASSGEPEVGSVSGAAKAVGYSKDMPLLGVAPSYEALLAELKDLRLRI